MPTIYLDVETKPTSRADIQARLVEAVKPPGNYKSGEAIEKWWRENGEAQKVAAVGETALNGLWGELACIGWAIDDGPVSVTTATTEPELLGGWTSDLSAAVVAHLAPASPARWQERLTWVGHNLQDFDIRFLWQRFVVKSVPLNITLPLGRYPQGPWIYDTMKEWCGYGKYVKQADLELAFGLTRTDPLKSGADVATADIASICAHCAEDVRLLREIHLRMTGGQRSVA